MSLIKKFSITIAGNPKLITVTANRTKNDYYGNPEYLVQVWTSSDNGNVWYPKLKGYRERKDQCYKLQSYNIEMDLNHFVRQFERELNERI